MNVTYAQFWDYYARCYDTVLKLVPYQDMLQEIIDYIPDEPLSLLDAGCGTGNLLITLKNQRPQLRLEGVDFSQAMLQRAKTKAHGTVGFRRANLNDSLPYANNTFDIVVCINVLYALAKPQNIMAEFSRVLKKQGMFFISTPQTQPKMSQILKEHVVRAGFCHTVPLLPYLALLAGFNLFILNRGKNKEYHFFDRPDLENLVGSHRITPTYAGQNWLVYAHRGKH